MDSSDKVVHRVYLNVLGIVLEIQCDYYECYSDILRLMSGHVMPSQKLETPDWKFTISLKTFNRYLHRERPESEYGTSLAGVSLLNSKSGHLEEWNSHLPPLVPFHHSANMGRFIALHAASIRLKTGKTVVFPGDRGAGKTTASIKFCNSYSGSLLTDEATFIHRRTRIVEPLTLAMGVFGEQLSEGKELIAAKDLCSSLEYSPSLATNIVFLNKTTKDVGLKKIAPHTTLVKLMQHQINVGADWDEIIVTMTRFARDVDSYELCWSSFDELHELLEQCHTLLSS